MKHPGMNILYIISIIIHYRYTSHNYQYPIYIYFSIFIKTRFIITVGPLSIHARNNP